MRVLTRRSSSSLFLIAVTLTFSGIVRAATFIPLGMLPGGFTTCTASAVSPDGSVVIGICGAGGGVAEPYIWNAIDGMQPLAGIGIDVRGVAIAATAMSGSAVVGNNPQAHHWDSVTGSQALGDLPGGNTGSNAGGISNDGSVLVGQGQTAVSDEAFIWDAVNGMVGLGSLPGGSAFSDAIDVSADGSVVVGEASSGTGHFAFTWDAVNGMSSLGDLPGGISLSYARAVSADGLTVVGRGHRGPTNGFGEAFIWDAGNGMEGLGLLSGPTSVTEAHAISGDGSVALGSSWRSDLGSEPFIWDATNGIRFLKDFLSAEGADFTDWHLSHVAGISDDGNIIVGHGVNPGGSTEAFVVAVPEPRFAVVLASGLLGIVFLQRSTARSGAASQTRNSLRSCGRG